VNRHDLFVKVCGITRPEDAELAAELGASAIGFIFWPGSPRYIPPAEARAIVQRKSAGVKAVGVFVDEPIEQLRHIAEFVGLDLVQLHGSESAAAVHDCRDQLRLHRPAPCVIKAVGLSNGAEPDLSEIGDDVLILLDAHDPERHGGTGRTVDWSAARRVAAARRTLLSGGLTPDNVGLAISSVRPFGVDVSSGVESAPGVKDAARLKSFFEALND
jgi:phosphoribosylanthranilate isomerase